VKDSGRADIDQSTDDSIAENTQGWRVSGSEREQEQKTKTSAIVSNAINENAASESVALQSGIDYRPPFTVAQFLSRPSRKS